MTLDAGGAIAIAGVVVIAAAPQPSLSVRTMRAIAATATNVAPVGRSRLLYTSATLEEASTPGQDEHWSDAKAVDVKTLQRAAMPMAPLVSVQFQRA